MEKENSYTKRLFVTAWSHLTKTCREEFTPIVINPSDLSVQRRLVFRGWIVILILVLHQFNVSSSAIVKNVEDKVVLIKTGEHRFSPELLMQELERLNISHPDIVYAQAFIESGGFKSSLFKENHNLFGMKEATQRATTSCGTKNGHAEYANWKESVYDYALYYNKYLSRITSREEYLNYIAQAYAEDPDYLTKIKKVKYGNK